MKRLFLVVSGILALGIVGCGGDSSTGDNPECQGAAVTPFSGPQQLLVSALQVGTKDDGFDLDGDGLPDNKLALAGTLAAQPLKDAFDAYSMIIPIEMFDIEGTGADECVKLAMYLGTFVEDVDQDGATTVNGGDCNDGD